jgi:hypothetical protein
MLYIIDRSFALTALLLLSLSGMMGCSDNPIEEDDHAEIHGLILRDDSAIEVLRIEEDSVRLNMIVLPVGATRSFELLFLGHHGETILPEDEIIPAIESSDTNRVRAAFMTGQTWTVSLEGKAEGSAAISVVLRHGTHDDFRSPPFTVVVE